MSIASGPSVWLAARDDFGTSARRGASNQSRCHARDDRDHDLCSGWTKTVRPSARYTARIKIRLIHELELDGALLVDFELDHRIPPALGGAPSDPRNLELQPWDEAIEKDKVEGCLAHAVCAGKLGLDAARRAIWTDWRHAGAGCDAVR